MSVKVALAGGVAGGTQDIRLEVVRATAAAAGEFGTDLLCFPEWFLGVEAVSDLPALRNEIRDIVAESGVAIATGNILSGDASDSQAERILAFSSDGTILLEETKNNPYQLEEHNYQLEEVAPEQRLRLSVAQYPWGVTLIVNGLDVADEELWSHVMELDPRLVVLQLNPSSILEYEALKEFAINLSEALGAAICAPILTADSTVIGAGSFMAAAGEIVAESEYLPGSVGNGDIEEAGAGDILVAEIEVELIARLPRMSSRVVMPELLRQRFLSETAGGSYFSDIDGNS